MMSSFIKILKEYLEESGRKVDELFTSGVVSENTFYKYNQRNPSLKTLIKIANFYEVSIDYLFDKSPDNNFRKYNIDQSSFYDRVLELLSAAKISCRKFSRDLNYSRDNMLRWKKGTEPSLQSLMEIADYFHCTPDDLLDRE